MCISSVNIYCFPNKTESIASLKNFHGEVCKFILRKLHASRLQCLLIINLYKCIWEHLKYKFEITYIPQYILVAAPAISQLANCEKKQPATKIY